MVLVWLRNPFRKRLADAVGHARVSAGPSLTSQIRVDAGIGARLGITLGVEVLGCRLVPAPEWTASGELPMGMSGVPQPSRLLIEVDYRLVLKDMEVLEEREERAEVWVGPGGMQP